MNVGHRGGLRRRDRAFRVGKFRVQLGFERFSALFRFRTQLKSKTELMVILTPHIIRNRYDSQRMLCKQAAKMDCR